MAKRHASPFHHASIRQASGLSANLPSQTASRIHPERNIGLSLLFAEARRPRHNGRQNSGCEITVRESILDADPPGYGVGPWGPLQSRVKIARRNKSRSIESHSGVQLLWTPSWRPVPLEFRGAERSTA
jgi:hypothetical protein